MIENPAGRCIPRAYRSALLCTCAPHSTGCCIRAYLNDQNDPIGAAAMMPD